jgi:Concanavalin A-like lectin/glucanases superfamily/Viral BACON domain
LATLLWLIILLAVNPPTVNASSTIFGGGPFYSGGTSAMNTLRASGYTTVMLWCIHVDANTGNLIYNDQLVVSNGVYVGNAAWPSQLATLKTAPTSVNRIEVSVSSWGVNDFQAIQTLMNTYGTNTTSILYRNFAALKTATGADAIDYDDETLYDVTTAVKFGQMLSSIGYKVTLCPFTNPNFWQSVYNQLGTGIVDAVYLQCYDGGAGNNPATWNGYFSGLKVQPGMWCKHGGGCADGNSSADVLNQMTAWRASAGITGGFMWLYDDMLSCTSGGVASDYAKAINTALDPLLVTPTTGFTAVTANNSQYIPTSNPFTLTNSSATALNWSIINTSAWLTVSSSSGTLAANGSAVVNLSLNSLNATNLPLGIYSANVLFSNRTSGVVVSRVFTLDTAIYNWPVTVSGYNAALLAANSATAGNPGATAFDIPNNYCFYQSGLSGSTRGLPLNGVFASQVDNATAFQVGPYGITNALLLGNTYPRSGTLTFATPQPYNSLAIVACSANGGGTGTFVINFTNGTKSQVFSFNAQDWFFNTANVAIQGFGRLRLGASLTIEDNGASNPNLYQTTINLAALGLTQSISSITFSNPASAGAQQTTAIFAISGMPSSVPVRAPARLTAIPGTNGTVKLTWNPSAGAIRYNIKRSVTSGGAYEIVGSPAGSSFTDSGLANGTIYYYVASAVGTMGESVDSAEVSAAPGFYQGWVFAWNPVGYWPLNETSGTTAIDLVRGSNGVSAGGFSQGFAGLVGAGFGTPHRATHYNGTTGYTQLPLLIGNTNFTIVFWVQTTAMGGTPNWYNGKGLVDGEVAGAANDFGIALVGAKAGFGIGNPDTTITSARVINNGLWHQVAATWDAGSGAMKLFIDGTLDASGTGPTGARTAPPSLRVASLQTGGNVLLGNMSDVAMYDQVLSPSQVATLYSAATGLFYNVTLTNSWNGGNLTLSWPGNGKLLEATDVAGPWTTNNAVAPVTVTPTAAQKFYRIQTQ